MDPLLKKPKTETCDEPIIENGKENDNSEESEQEEALVALVEHRTTEVERLRQRLTYYQGQLEVAEKRLVDTQSKLARHRSKSSANGSKKDVNIGVGNVKIEPRSAGPLHKDEGESRHRSKSSTDGSKKDVNIGVGNVKIEPGSASPLRKDEGESRAQGQSRPQLIIPAVNPKIGQPIKSGEANMKMSVGTKGKPITSGLAPSDNAGNLKGDASCRSSSGKENVELQNIERKRKFEQKEHMELIPCVRSSTSPTTIRIQPGTHFSSQHNRKLRSLVLSPTSDQLFVTSALNGVVNLWQLQAKGSSASLLSTTDCASPKQRRWPEDMTWHPYGDSLFAVYSADGGDSQISVLNLNSSKEKRVFFLEEKPHIKGVINSIIFMPWTDLCFATGGSDHAVIMWNEKDSEGNWKPKTLHRNLHSSAVMGVAGVQHKQMVMSAGADKRIVGFDIQAGRAEFKNQIESKCMSVLPNPTDFNLFMVQTGAPEKQLRLYDIRLRNTELHAFGWKQESSESQSALINQAWSPDGLYITSGSADPMIHIFDIRYNSRNPSQSVKAHQKRVFKAVWHHALPLLISISSDLNIGLHRVI